MKQRFVIDDRLPGYNDLHQQPWYKSRRIKQNAMDTVMWYARIAGLKPIQGRCIVTITCYEPNARRDVDNVKAGANKVILDALQQMGILKGDGRKYVADTYNPPVEVDRRNPRVEVVIEDEV